IFISVSDERQDKLKAFSVGGADYITKPFWFEEVQARVANQVTMYRLQQRLKLQTKRALASKGQMPLLADLQRMLHRQATRLKAQNERLQKEIHERKHAEKALRREKYKSEKLLLNILPQAVVDQLKQFQGSLAERFDDATILFADIVNFTPLAAQVTPLELVQLLNQIFSTFDRLAEEHGLEKIKTIGDAYMVVGGLPVPNDNHIEAVINMAIAMQAAIQTFTRADGQPLQLRIGINTGAVVAGVIGIKKFSYDLWGDAVNVASRMESQGVPGKIQVTETTYQRLKHKYYFTPAGEVTIKGKGQMRTYHLAGKVEN
ncbi:MAG: adenylate/guanylate cyclase domain-containing protein, partial [Cyanobacteria bacterium J06659_2]